MRPGRSRFRDRSLAARRLTKDLGPRIRVRVKQSEGDRAYRDAIADSLKGSGLHYSTLAPLIAESMSPRELALAAEQMDSGAMATATGLSKERSTRVLSQLRTVGAEEILTAPIDDGVERTLLMARSTSQRLIFPPDKDVPLSCRLSSITGASQSWSTSPRTIWTTPSSLRRLSLPCGIVQAVTNSCYPRTTPTFLYWEKPIG